MQIYLYSGSFSWSLLPIFKQTWKTKIRNGSWSSLFFNSKKKYSGVCCVKSRHFGKIILDQIETVSRPCQPASQPASRPAGQSGSQPSLLGIAWCVVANFACWLCFYLCARALGHGLVLSWYIVNRRGNPVFQGERLLSEIWPSIISENCCINNINLARVVLSVLQCSWR